MRQMIADVAVTLNVAGRVYTAAAGDTIEAHDDDVSTLERYGVRPTDGPGEDPPAGEESTDDLEELTLGELRSRATAAEIPGRSRMDREELLEALRTDNGQEA